jgi:FkbM family methyltransferase
MTMDVMRLNTPGKLNQIGKWITPVFGRLAAGHRATGLIELSSAYLNCLIGKGAGTGWDKGEEIAAARLIKRKDPVILDIGANWGDWMLEVRRLIGGQGRWLLVEPAAECCVQLRTLNEVEVIEAAVGERAGMATLYTPGDKNGLASLHERHDSVARGQNFTRRDVRVTTIDEILAERGIELVDFAKMDLEGHELFALRGAAESLKHLRLRALTFEFGTGNVNSRTFFRDFWDLLTGYGYRIERIYPGGKTVPVDEYYEDLEFFRGVTNYVALAPHKKLTTAL